MRRGFRSFVPSTMTFMTVMSASPSWSFYLGNRISAVKSRGRIRIPLTMTSRVSKNPVSLRTAIFSMWPG